ncbi:TetR family transcriptional regulator [Actinophytocola xinjiangensis]|uniref:TetR family transcriptional regulator n=1 Tax=Actinophytocola xinjiangensis TaxID=485602 RepID=A0A7Z0WR80_9PSEU|nr:TetR/AcrR family transcriptional regulator [Actinophytocola xinjiangensis]OLF13863.1 TetR family transcriptional regulator [Actinophytocola xinjiangensis]
MTPVPPAAARAGDTRDRLLATALELFAQHGVEGTSLQMIADALGVTKAAVYYHFKTKDEITEAVAEPALRQLGTIAREATTLRRRGAQVDHVLAGIVELVVGHRALAAVFSSDPGVARALERTLHEEGNVKECLTDLLCGGDSDPAAKVAAHVAMLGIALAGGSPGLDSLTDDELRRHLMEAGRRLLGRPRRRD